MTNGEKDAKTTTPRRPFGSRHAARRRSPFRLSMSRETTLEQEKTSAEHLMKNTFVHAMEWHSLFGRSSAVHAAIVLFGLVACCPDAYSQLAGLAPRGRFETASVIVPAGNSCLLHPDGNSDPTQSIPVNADEDGVARFQAVRPAQQDSVDRLALECTDANGISQTYLVDLRSEATFAPRPFNPAFTTLAVRPALTRDPLSYTQQDLIQGGYGLRPDPIQNPDGYNRWLAAASQPVYKLRSAARSSSTPSHTRRRPISQPSAQSTVPELDATVYTSPSSGWTGAILQGSYKKNATSALTYSYVLNEATFNVPTVTPGGFGTGATAMTIWNGLGNVFQAIVDVNTTATTASFGIHHQDFDPWTKGNDTGGTRFTPKPGDSIYAEEWYCDAKGNLNLSGGYACTLMVDNTQGVEWECDQANSSECTSYTLKPADLANGNLGFWADFIIEDDTGEVVKNSAEWPDFSPVTMTGSAFVVQGSGTSGIGQWVTTSTDPLVELLTDANASVPFVRGDEHLRITLPTGGVKWTDVQTNIYSWDGSNFNTYWPGCATSIGVGPNSRGLTYGTPWITDCTPAADGNYAVHQMQTGGAWVKMQDDVGYRIAVSPDAGIAWAVNGKGQILYWNGSKFIPNPAGGGCATSIGVGPATEFQPNGTPWIVGCTPSADGNFAVYEMLTGGTSEFHLTSWVKMQDDVATKIAVSPDGTPWVVNSSGGILYWNGKKFVPNPTGGCATSIGVGPNSRGLTNGTPWVMGCSFLISDDNAGVYQMQTAGAWVSMQNDVGIAIAVAPDANHAWAISTLKY